MENLIGKKFNRLTVVDFYKREATYNKNNKLKYKYYWRCKCDCGKEKILLVESFKYGHIKSCGCLQKETVIKRNKIGKQNEFELKENYYVGYMKDGKEFYFDIEDYEKVNKYYWAYDHNGYPFCTKNLKNRKKLSLHQLIMGIFEDYDIVIDHINHNKFDNRKENLRICTRQQNGMNKPIQKSNMSGFIGVHYDNTHNKWKVQLRKNGNMIYSKYFNKKEEAIIARLKAEKECYGEFSPQKHLFEKYGIT